MAIPMSCTTGWMQLSLTFSGMSKTVESITNTNFPKTVDSITNTNFLANLKEAAPHHLNQQATSMDGIQKTPVPEA